MTQQSKAIVNVMLETVGKPITGVHWGDKPCVFYPYAGPCPVKGGGLLGFVKTRQGPVHGRFFTKGQFFHFEPGDFEIDPDSPQAQGISYRDRPL